MGEILLQNTLTGRKETFATLHPGEVRMYTCGPTVYDFAHIGNFRTFVFQDILRRFLKSEGYRVLQVMNLTDVDDRIIANAAAAGIGIREYTEKYIAVFLADRRALGLEAPEHIVRATDHIDDMVELIERLTANGFTYTSDGSIYYRISRFPGYGKLSKIDLSGVQAGARVEVDRYEKADARDFALWKSPKPGEHFWETPLGPGRPGWHIECSAMAMKYLGETLDIHTGGIDLAFPHHENEIAQSEAATGKPFARFWLHAEHLLVNGQKMSKSLGNFYTLRDLLTKGHNAWAIRYLLASVPYRSQINFTFEALKGAVEAVEKLRNLVIRLRDQFPRGSNELITERANRALAEFREGLKDDLNTARALAAIHELRRDANTAMDRGEFRQGDVAPTLAAMESFDAIFAVLREDVTVMVQGVGATASVGPVAVVTDVEIEALVADRQAARKRRDFAAADRIRQQLADRGIILQDTRNGGVRWKRK